MSRFGRSLIDVAVMSKSDVKAFFEAVRARSQTADPPISGVLNRKKMRRASLLFLEPSTRTLSSFAIACSNLGIETLTLIGDQSSVSKGESLEDTLLTLEAMGVGLHIVRHKGIEELQQVSAKLQSIVICAGEGTSFHPTQALVDGYTLWSEGLDLSELRLLFVGDVRHSRVVRSNVALLSLFGAKFGFCGPQELLPSASDYPDVSRFQDLEEGVGWCNSIMALRVQLERHDELLFSREDYLKKYQLREEVLGNINKNAILLHPGPVNQGVEISREVFLSPRSRILKQVENGVSVRTQLIFEMCREWF